MTGAAIPFPHLRAEVGDDFRIFDLVWVDTVTGDRTPIGGVVKFEHVLEYGQRTRVRITFEDVEVVRADVEPLNLHVETRPPRSPIARDRA